MLYIVYAGGVPIIDYFIVAVFNTRVHHLLCIGTLGLSSPAYTYNRHRGPLFGSIERAIVTDYCDSIEFNTFSAF